MRGCITKKGSNYCIVIDIGKDSNGKRKQKWYSGYRTKKDAEKDLAKKITELENNTFIYTEKITVAEYLMHWLETYVDVNLSETTIYGYRHLMEKHVIPTLGNITLQKLQPIQIQQLYNEKMKHGRLDGTGGLSAKSICYIHRVLRKALSQAVKLQILSRNVADFVDIPKRKNFNATTLNEDAIKKLLLSFENTKFYIPVVLAVGVGLRRGETLGLRWQDIDFNNKTISINQTILHANNGIIWGTPKTDRSHRTIVVSDSILQIFKNHMNAQKLHKDFLGDNYTNHDLINCNEDGSAINPSTFSKAFAKVLKKNNLPTIRFHDLRHTNATLMLKNNIPAKIASERLGHSAIGITMDLYSHVMNEMQEEAAIKLDNVLFNNN